MSQRRLLSLLVLAVSLAPPTPAQVNDLPPELAGVTIDQRIGEKVPFDVTFLDENGREVRLGDYFREGRPVLFTLNYSDCPQLCSVQLNSLADALREVDLQPERDFLLVTVSIDPNEKPDKAKKTQMRYVERTMRPEFERGWHFLTGDEEHIRAFADAVGFHYKFIPETGEFSHPPALVLVTPSGEIGRYLPSIADYQPVTLKYSIIETSEGRLGDVLDAFFLTCFHYDPEARGYVAMAQNIMKLGGALTVLALLAFWFFWFHLRHRHRSSHATSHRTAEAGTR